MEGERDLSMRDDVVNLARLQTVAPDKIFARELDDVGASVGA